MYQDEVHGNLFQQADKTLDLLLTKYMRANISYEGITRVEKYPFPKNALREALLNAIVHKDYSSGVPIQISVYEDKIIFWNDGHLPENWTVKQLLEKHPSKPYNPLIANVFFRTGLIESWGRGIEKINIECKLAGVPAPRINYDFAGLMITFKARGKSKMPAETREKTREKILKLILEDSSVSTEEMSKRIGITKKGIEWQIMRLKKDGILQRIGPAKGGYWEIIGKKS